MAIKNKKNPGRQESGIYTLMLRMDHSIGKSETARKNYDGKVSELKKETEKIKARKGA